MNKSLLTSEEDSRSKVNTLYMIGNAHIDPVWLWQWHEGMQEIKATFRSALDRLQEYDDFVFTASSAAFYAWIEENEPEMFAEIKTRVAEGRWEIVGGWWVEPDCNIPCGEALVRQALYGQHYFKSRFGKTTRVGYNPDSFGHNATIPQILKRSGCDYYVFMRPGPHENSTLHQVFWWEADDGLKVLTYRIPYAYTAWGSRLEDHIRRCSESVPGGMETAMCFYGVGNHGGGPTRENIHLIRSIDQAPDSPRLIFSTIEQYFSDQISEGITHPVIHNELQHHASGCYSAHTGVKRWNRQAENALITAEKWAAIVSWISAFRYPRRELEGAWKLVLFNQFHDILAGTSIESAYEDARNLYSSAIATADAVKNAALQRLSWSIKTTPSEEGHALIVFNPHAWRSTVPVEVELGWFDPSEICLLDAREKPVVYQRVHPHTSLMSSRRLCFIADLPPLGYHAYKIIPLESDPMPQRKQPSFPLNEIETSRYRLVFDPESGTISSLYDIFNQCNVFRGEGNRAIIIDDPSDTWSHGIFQFDKVIGAFANPTFRLLEHGNVKTTLQVTLTYKESTLIQEYTLYQALPRIDVRVNVDWHEPLKMLKLCFPFNVIDATATYEIPYGHILRPMNGQEEPGQNWVDISGKNPETYSPYGVSLLNDGKYSYSIEASECRLTVLRSPIYAHHTPFVPSPDGVYTYMDQGRQTFTYAILPHSGTWKEAKTVRHAAEINQPAFTLKETQHSWANLPPIETLITVSPDNILLSAVKLAEDNDDLILRCVEMQNTSTKATIKLFGCQHAFTVHFLASEIKTMRINAERNNEIREVNLLEN